VVLVTIELLNVGIADFENLLDCFRPAIPAADPDDFGRRPKQQAALVKIRILGNNDEALLSGEIPNRVISRILEPVHTDVRGIRVERRESLHESIGQVLGKE